MVDALLKALMAAALLATGASALALLLGAAGVELLVLPHAVVLISSGAIALIGHVAMQLMARHRYGTKQFNQMLKQHSPRWMRWLCHGLSIAALLLWLFLAFRNYEPPSGGVPSLIAGTFVIFFAPAASLMFYSYLSLRPQFQRRCSRDHEIPVGATYCPQCGEHVRPVA